MKKVIKDIFFEVDFQYPGNLHEAHNDFPFLPERTKIKKVEKLVTRKLNMLFQ